jgi:TRAP-type uncharacterized transport system substrate-binding protein
MGPLRRLLLGIGVVGLTLLSGSLAMKAGRLWQDRVKKLTFCVARDGVDQRFAERLAAATSGHTHPIQIDVKPIPDPVAAFERRECDLAVARADAKLPAWTRSLAILEKDVVLLVAHRGKAPDSAAALRNRKLILATPEGHNDALLRAILTAYALPQAERRIVVPPNPASVAESFAASPASVIFAVTPRSKLLQGNLLRGIAQKYAIALADMPEAAALTKKIRGLSEETVEKGLISAAPLLPAEELTTLSLEVRLVARGSLRDATAAELTRFILENKGDLALNGEFGDSLEPPDTDKNAPVLSHPGAAQYVNDEEKTFIDLYGDYLYLGAPVAGGVGSFLIWLFSRWTRGAPCSAGDLTQQVLDVAARARGAATTEELDAADEQLDLILNETLGASRDKRLSLEGLEIFRLAYDQTREWIRARRHLLAERSPPASGGAENLL